MKRLLIGLAIAAIGMGFGATVGFLGGHVTRWETTVSRLSPDETLRALLVERALRFDRNFQIRLEDLARGGTLILFHSPDEGDPRGSERLIWSKDGKWLLLVGRHFFVKQDLFLDNGDQLYYLYEVASGKAWTNAKDDDVLPALNAETIQGIEFTEPIVLKPR